MSTQQDSPWSPESRKRLEKIQIQGFSDKDKRSIASTLVTNEFLDARKSHKNDTPANQHSSAKLYARTEVDGAEFYSSRNESDGDNAIQQLQGNNVHQHRPFFGLDYLIRYDYPSAWSLHVHSDETEINSSSETSIKKQASSSVLDHYLELVRDTLRLLLGIPGSYFVPVKISRDACVDYPDREPPFDSSSSIFFQLRDSQKLLNPSMKQLVSSLVPLGTDFAYISLFAHMSRDAQYGRICNALGEGLELLLQDYTEIVLRCERRVMDLIHDYSSLLSHSEQPDNEKQKQRLCDELLATVMQMLLFTLQPSIRTLRAIKSILKAFQFPDTAHHTSLNYGAKIICILHVIDQRASGNIELQTATKFLLQKCLAPFFMLLYDWLNYGTICDEWNEFFIMENSEYDGDKESGRSEEYWDKRFTVRLDYLPDFLEDYKDMILQTGKFLNVIKESTKLRDKDDTDEKCFVKATWGEDIEKVTFLEFSTSCMSESDINDQYLSKFVLSAFESASSKLLTLITKKYRLLQTLRALKKIFLCEQGDMLISFINMAHTELSKDISVISRTKLQSIWELAIRNLPGSVPESRLMNESISCKLNDKTLLEQLQQILGVRDELKDKSSRPSKVVNGFEAFAIDVKISWPLCLVISRKSLVKYQLIFRLLFSCKSVHYELSKCWIHHQATQRSNNLRTLLSKSFTLRHRMTLFIENFWVYISSHVIEWNWRKLEQSLVLCSSFDTVMQKHDDFLATCLRECLITNVDLLKFVAKLLTVCRLFALSTQRVLSLLVSLPANKGESSLPGSALWENSTMRKLEEREYWSAFERYESTFDTYLAGLLKALEKYSTIEADHKYISLVDQLNLNKYFKTDNPA